MSSKITALLEKFPNQTRLTVQWGEMDAYRHVNNLVYLRWAETGRIEYFQRLKLNLEAPEKEAYGVILGWQDCKYIFPVSYPDTVIVGTQVTEIKKDRFNMECRIYSVRHDRLVAISNHQIITFDYKNQQKINVPEELKKRIAQLEATSSAKE